MDDLTHASFFSGAGGLDLGLGRAGWRTVSFSEIDPYASAVLAQRWPGVPNLGDITRVASDGVRPDGGSARTGSTEPGRVASAEDREWGGDRLVASGAAAATLWSGGFPCQDLSVAGKRRGMGAGTRSGLAFSFLDLVGRHRPRFVLLENVPGLLSSHAGRDFGTLLATLVELGYGVGYRVLDARYFGVPQRRRRVFILGDSLGGRAGAECAAEVLSVGSRCRRHPPTGVEAGSGVTYGASESASWLGGHGTRTLGAAMGHHGYTMGAQDADGGYLQVSSTVTGKWAKGSGGPAGSEEGNLTVVPAILAGGGRLGHGDKDQHIVLGSSPDSRGVRAPDGLARGPHDRDGVDLIEGGEQSYRQRDRIHSGLSPSLDARGDSVGDPPIVAYRKATKAYNPDDWERWESADQADTLDATGMGGIQGTAILGASGMTNDPLLPLGLDSHRYRCCGNGVVADVGEWIGQRLAALVSS